ncbi:hypothetical protein BVRB_8g186780 [Beta vulgaris subsp. vulgaris]|nr:hypothetical protein BVRB_8g186780 [Beta vulgaris subsp. vulgaris]
MEASSVSLMLCLLFFSHITHTVSQRVLPCLKCIDSYGNYSSTSAYSRNLNSLLSLISTNTQINNGFYNLSVGKNPNSVYGIAVCRGDMSVSDCRKCLIDATERLPGECPTQKEAIGYYFSNCMLHYSDRAILGIKELNPNCTKYNAYNIPVSDMKMFNQKLSILFKGLKAYASAGDSRSKFATGYENVTASLQVYGLMQCNPDLSESDCSDCLQAGVRYLEFCCNTVVGAGYYGPSCSVEFENYQFINVLTKSSQPPLSPSCSLPSGCRRSEKGKGKDTYKYWIIIVVLFVLLALLATLVFWFSRRSRKRKLQEETENNVQITCVDSLQVDFRTIQVATDNFSGAQRLGKGSTVYKGMLPNEQEIAVRTFDNDKYSEVEFNNEVMLLANLQHRNMVKLIGVWAETDSRLIVYEYLPNESLSGFLCGEGKGESLPSHAWRKWCEGKALETVDETLLNVQSHATEISRCIKIALLCVQEDPFRRPTMSTVIFMLNSNVVTIAEPSRPAFIIYSDMDLSSSSSSGQKHKSYEASVNETSITELDPR